jgi:hypothetical protein
MKRANYYICAGEMVRGPTTADRLRTLAAKGKLSEDALIARGEENNDWFRAGDLPGLFGNEVGAGGELIRDPLLGAFQTMIAAFRVAFVKIKNNVKSAAAENRWDRITAEKEAIKVVRGDPAKLVHQLVQPASRCPFCREAIQPDATKCRYCGEMLDPVLRRLRDSSTPAAAPAAELAAPATQVVHAHNTRRFPKWNRGVAAVLSFFFPGLGQLYKGQVRYALAWFTLVSIGYCAFVIPGLVLHLFCVIGATTGDPCA